MKKELKIMNYCNKIATVNLENFEDVVRLKIEVVSGDEILHVLYKDYTEKEYDSCYMLGDMRFSDFPDDEYVIYDITKNIDHIEKWSKRKDSYHYPKECE